MRQPERRRTRASQPHARSSLNDLSGTEWIKFTKSWFVCDSRRYHKNRDTELHPARFPEEMVGEFLSFFTKRGEWVLDPFAGSGATLVSCAENGRNGVGIELTRKYAEIARGRIGQHNGGQLRLDGAGDDTVQRVLCADARQLDSPDLWRDDCLAGIIGDDGLPRFDFVITSPPYWSMLHTSRGGVFSAHKERASKGLDVAYSDRDEDLGNIADYDRFIEEVGGVFDRCARLLRPGRYLVAVAQNLRAPDGEVRPLAWDLARRVSRTLLFQGERIWCQNSKRLGIWGYPTVFVPNYHHHYCLIFRRAGASGGQ
jgi:SAM-dependent methyltransferase